MLPNLQPSCYTELHRQVSELAVGRCFVGFGVLTEQVLGDFGLRFAVFAVDAQPGSGLNQGPETGLGFRPYEL